MKKPLAIALIIGALASSASAAVTYQFSSTANFATNFLNGTGGNTSTMVWGIVVDALGNGFAGASEETPYDAGFAYSANAGNGVTLSTVNTSNVTTATDDVLYISSNLMNLTSTNAIGELVGVNRITNLSSINYSGNVGLSDAFRIVWFNVTALSGNSADGTKYGLFEMPSLNTLQADPGTYNVSAAFAGQDAPKAMSYTLGTAVPEPSIALLGALGIFGLVRRRR
jgi:hypothetical protein